MSERNLETAEKLHGKLQTLLEQRRNAQIGGVAALQRLVRVAQRDTGQSSVVARFLIGLYNGHAHPFNLTDLRRLDLELHQDCMAVLAMDYQPVQEIHLYLKDGDRVMGQLIENWGVTE